MGSSPFPHHRLGHVPVQISPLEESHLPQLMQVQTQAYAGLPVLEPVEFFRNRRQLAPQGCLVALAGNRVTGYLVSYPWDDGLPPALGELLDALPEPGRHWFVHDCAVSPNGMVEALPSACWPPPWRLHAGRVWAACGWCRWPGQSASGSAMAFRT